MDTTVVGAITGAVTTGAVATTTGAAGAATATGATGAVTITGMGSPNEKLKRTPALADKVAAPSKAAMSNILVFIT